MIEPTKRLVEHAYFAKRNPSVEAAKKIADILGFQWTRFYEDGKNTGQTSA